MCMRMFMCVLIFRNQSNECHGEMIVMCVARKGFWVPATQNAKAQHYKHRATPPKNTTSPTTLTTSSHCPVFESPV